ncbi:MAG: hypothetical protein PCFJNLEI_02169 [Verrucomicrobiae bacterium]|nr:hypothetical protein [Verrucomicrobiae bacterium]
MKRRTTLHEQMVKVLRSEVLSRFQAGDCLPTLSELAEQYDVSTSSIRSALLTLAHEGLVTLRHGSGCYVTAPVSPVTACIGIFTDLDLFGPLAYPFQHRVIGLLRSTLRESGYEVRVYCGEEQWRQNPVEAPYPEFVADVQAGRLAGVVALPYSLLGQWLDVLRERELPVVHLDYTRRPGTVNLDYAALVRQGVAWLWEQGCRRLALTGYGGGTLGKMGTTDCARIFAEEFAARGGDYQAEWVRVDLNPALPGTGWSQFRELWTAHTAKPDGLLITDDALLPDVALAVRELGVRVPDELQVVTHFNRAVSAEVGWPAARLEFDPQTVAVALAELLRRRLRGEVDAGAQVTLGPQLIRAGQNTGVRV